MKQLPALDISTKSYYEELERRVISLENEVSRHIKTEKLLRESEWKHRRLVENAYQSFLIIQDLHFVFVNEAFSSLTGYSMEELLSLAPEDVKGMIHSDDQKIVWDGMRKRLLKESAAPNFQFRILRKDGTVRWVETFSSCIEYADRSAVQATFIDITERKYAEKALWKSEEKFRLLENNVSDVIWIWNIKKNCFTYFSPSVEKSWGWTVEEALGLSFQHTLTPESLYAAINKMTNKMSKCRPCGSKSITLVLEHYRKDGSTFWIEVKASFKLDNNNSPTMILGISRDITERKRTEKAMRYRIEFERLITTLSTRFINVVPKKLNHEINLALGSIGRLSRVDRSYVFLFSDDKTKINNTHEWCAEGIEPQIDNLKNIVVDIELPWLLKKIKRFETIHIPSVEDLPHEAGTEKEHLQMQDIQSLIAVPMIYGGALIGFLGFDVVRREKSWSEDSITLLKLVGEIFSNTLVHKRTQKQLLQSEKMAALGGMVSGVAHEISTPVGISITASSYLEDKSKELNSLFVSGAPDNIKLQKYIHSTLEASSIIHSNLNRAADLINSFKQVAFDQSNENRRQFKLKKYINEVLISLQPQYKNTRHKILVDCNENLILNSYPSVLSQILTNLVINSLIHGFEYIVNGTISLYIRAANNHLYFQYSDNGKGMSEDTLKKIYDPFFTTKRNHGRTGLGMHIVYNLVTQTLNGKVECYGNNGSGMICLITIPIDGANFCGEEN